MLGINQTILLALSMIIICAMVGTRDLGQEVFKALSKADAGRGIVAGLAIAFIGIIADRLITAWVQRMRQRRGWHSAFLPLSPLLHAFDIYLVDWSFTEEFIMAFHGF